MLAHEDDDPTTPADEAAREDAEALDAAYSDVLEALQERDEAIGLLHEAEGTLRRYRELCAIRLQRIEELERELVKARRFAQRLLDTHPDHMPSVPRRARMAGIDPDEHALRDET